MVAKLLAGRRVLGRCGWHGLVVAVVALGVGLPAALAAGGRSESEVVSSSYTPVPRVADLRPSEIPDPNDLLGVIQEREEVHEAARERRERRASSVERERRVRSRSAFAGRGRERALSAARRAHRELMERPVWARPALAPGEEVVGYAGDHLTRIRRKGEKTGAVAYSPFPARVKADDGVKRPIDLSLVEHESSFVTANAPVNVRLPKRLADGIALGESGLSVRPPVSETVSSGVEEAGKVHWADVDTDTDFMVAPLPGAASIETFHVLRSAQAPEELPLMVDVPEGASLRRAGVPADGFGSAPAPERRGVEVVQDGQVIATIAPPSAVDADGEPVPVGLDIGGDRVTLNVAHRDADVAYPLVVDPVFSGYVRDDNTWRDGYSDFRGWQYYTNTTSSSFPSGWFTYLAGTNAAAKWGSGLYVGAFANGSAYCCQQYGEWLYYAPGTSFIYRADVTGAYHDASGSQWFAGISDATGWRDSFWSGLALKNMYKTFCTSDCGVGGAMSGNSFAIGMMMHGPTNQYGALAYLGRAYLYLSDPEAPTVTGVSHTGLPSGWVRPQALTNVCTTVTGHDPGLGIYAADILEAGEGVPDAPIVILCGDRNGRCPNNSSGTFSYDLSDASEGVHEYTAQLTEVLGRDGASAPWRVHIDATAPEISEVGGSLRAMDNRELSEDAYTVIADAQDPSPYSEEVARSGVSSMQLLLDGVQQPAGKTIDPAGCPGAACTGRHTWTVRPFDHDLSVGAHTFKVVVSDHAGNTAEESWTVKIAKGAMTSPRNGAISEKRLNLRAVAKRPGFSTARFAYRRASTESWTTIPAAHLRTISGQAVVGTDQPLSSNATQTLVWDASATLLSDTPVQIRAHFNAASGGDDNPSTITTVSYRPNGWGTDYARQELAPGEVDLITGNFILGEDDVSIDSYASDLTVKRTYASRAPLPRTAQGAVDQAAAGPFGPGWLPGATAAGSDYVKLEDKGAHALLTMADTTTVQFSATPSGSYDAQAGYEDLRLTRNGDGTFKLTDTAANITVFTKPSGASDFRPSTASAAGSQTTTNFEYQVVSGQPRMTRILAPRPAGVSSCTRGSDNRLPAGCRELRFTYATSTTAIGTSSSSQWGAYTGRLTAVTFDSGDSDMAALGEQVARYVYDSQGWLRAAWDPRISPALMTTYDYTNDLLSKVTPPGEQPWTMTYQPIGSDPAAGRLRAVSRSGPQGTATDTVVYDVPLSGTGAPYAMDAATTAQWAQADLPSDATAIFPADQNPGSGTPSSYSRATVHYLNGNLETATRLPDARWCPQARRRAASTLASAVQRVAYSRPLAEARPCLSYPGAVPQTPQQAVAMAFA